MASIQMVERKKTKQHLWRVIVLVEDKDADIDIRVE